MDAPPPPNDAADQNDPDFELRRDCSILESIALTYAEDSAERRALHRAAEAYLLVYQRRQLLVSFAKLLHAHNGTLPESVKADLRRRGLDPDALAAELEAELKDVPGVDGPG